MITIKGKKYRVVEDLRFVQDRQRYGKVVMTDSGERVVLKYGRTWEWATVKVGVLGHAVGQTT